MPKSTERCVRLCSLVAALAMFLSACGGSSSTSTTSTTTPTVTIALVTDTFTGTVGANGSAIHPFAVANGGYTLLAGYTTVTPNTVTSLGLGIGGWDGTTCGLNLTQVDAAKVGSTAITGTAGAANYCLRVYDGGNIPAGTTVSYTVQVQHY